MLCSISNRVPQNPVITKQGGYLFERSLIEKYIDEHGQCPVTGESLTHEDLLPVRGGIAGSAGSLPPLLGGCSVLELLERLRIEWDAVMLEQYSLRQQLAQTQQELAHALQQYEAACRVIASVTMECDKLRQEGQVYPNETNENDRFEETGVVVPIPLLTLIDSQEAEQREQRKQRRQSLLDSSNRAFLPFAETSRLNANLSKIGGALCVCVAKDFLYTAGTSSLDIIQYNLVHNSVLAKGVGHQKHVHTITTIHEGDQVISASEDQTVRIWKPEGAQLICQQTLRYINGVSALSRRLIGETYVLVGSSDGSVCISNIELGEQAVVATGAGDSCITCAELHPYASLAAIGTQRGELILWNVKLAAADTILSLREKPSSPLMKRKLYISSIDVHPDCVTLAAGLSDGRALVWDLRKVEQPVAEIVVSDDQTENSACSPVSVAFEKGGGGCLAVGMRGVTVYKTAKLLEQVPCTQCRLATLETEHTEVSQVCWPRSSMMALSCMDGVVRVFTA